MSTLLALLLWIATAWATTIPVLELDGTVDRGTADYVTRGIEDAEASDAPAVVIAMNTPGGLVESAREMVQAELESEIPVIVYVSPSGAWAGSAGVFVTLASHVAAMAPGTTIGAAHPVSLTGQGESQQPPPQPGPSSPQEDTGDAAEPPSPGDRARDLLPSLGSPTEQKAVNTIASWARAIAERRGRDPDWAEAAVRESATLTGREAHEAGIVEFVAEDLEALFEALDGHPVQVNDQVVRTLTTGDWEPEPVPMTRRQALVHLLANPNHLYLLLGLGMLGLWVEFHNPGLVVPGVLGLTLLVFAGVGLSTVPFNIAGLVLVVMGFVLFGLELYTTTFGALTVGGVAALVSGGMLLFEVENYDLSIDLSLLLGGALGAAACTLLVGYLVLAAHRGRVHTGSEALVGQEATVLTGGEGGGWVQVEGERWRARWTGHLRTGEVVRIREVERLRLVVEPPEPSPKG